MAKVDLTAAYRSVPVAARYWMSHVFSWDGEVLADTRAPFGNSSMPGIFTRFTRAIVRWMQAQGASIVGYLDDFLLVGSFHEVQEFMWLLHEFVTFLGFEVNPDKCEGPSQVLEFLGVELSTTEGVCTARISEDRMLVVQAKVEEMAVVVDPNSFLEIVVFAAMLTAFFFFFRKDNVSVEKADAWNPRGHLVRADMSFPVLEEGSRQVDIRVRHSKTIQAGERYHTVRAVEVPGSPICVVRALWRIGQLPNLGPDGPLFCTEDAKGRLKPLTHSVFVAVFRKLAARAGLDPAAYTGHSFRRGGATAAFRLQVQDALIQAHGDWASECYKLYCDMDAAQQLILPSAMASGAAAATRAFEGRA
ncbi:hypothetical protein CYMTET_15788 [Cymbomonas tetramitiformis]|uniref:Reverse transcriptase domain-containing protein n=1 Tax=Cymbomonas tetramitiformis TaxID=36881 RepID=A0AAE0L8T8_9CHLO|nr:hypothetical protein CYMTET_15788 [Cymbomonas tetramitiformis]